MRTTWLTVVALGLLAAVATAQTTTTRTDRLIASTQAIIGGTTLGANTLNVTGTLGVSSNATVGGTLGVTGDITTSGDVFVNGGEVRTASGTGLAIMPNGAALNLAPGTTLFLTPANNNALPGASYAVNLGSLTSKFLSVHAAELWVQTLVAQDVLSTIGGRILVLPTTQLSADLGDGAGDTTITVKHNSLASGDRIYLEANAKVEWMAVTSGAGGSAGAYTYSVTRDLDSSGRNAWNAGDAVANTGAAGDGWIDLYSVRGVASGGYGPAIVGQERLSATYNDFEPRWAIGNLNGVYGYSSDTYGAAFGDDDASNVVIDSTNGIRFRNGTTVLGSWVGSTVTLGQPLTNNNTGQIVIDSDSMDFKWRNNSGTTTTLMQIYNNGGVGEVYVAGSLVSTTDVRAPSFIYAGGDMTIYTTGTNNQILVRTTGSGALRPYADNATQLGNTTAQWSSIWGEAYYVGTTAGVSGTCSAVTVVNGIVTGCTP